MASATPSGTTTIIAEPKLCDFCKMQNTESTIEAKVDGKTWMGQWANMCRVHFVDYGIGLGLGKGQLLIVQNLDAA
jgi:hypothetical protein